MGVAGSGLLISVIIPTYNCELYIIEAIESVLQQDECLYEIIVIDDGSTDKTKEILEPYEDRIRYFLQTNQGVAAARNHGISQANGDLIAFLDADDYFLPGKLAAQANKFKEQPDIGIVHSGWRRVNAEGGDSFDVRPWEYVPQLDLAGWLRWKPVLPSAMMFRREWLDYVSGFDLRFPPAEDTDLVLRLALAGCQTAWLQEVTVNYRQHEQSAMHQGLPQAKSLSAVMDNFFAKPNLPNQVKLMECSVRYGTSVWIAWYLFDTGHLEAMSEYLKKSWQYSPFSPMETTINWIDSFGLFAQNWGTQFNIYELTQTEEWRDLIQWVINAQDKVQQV